MALTGKQLSDGEISLLEKLNQRPVELGDLPRASAQRLISLGLARIVLGTCEITRAGQLTCQRDRYRKALRGRPTKFTPCSAAAMPARRNEDTERADIPFLRRWIARLTGVSDAKN